ncbi:MAG TPA: AIR synthase-related protein [Candidatus Acidoferrales bacterium]|nr:AIR synthase-related protein [Candidatus Acidoferrales bacterium]
MITRIEIATTVFDSRAAVRQKTFSNIINSKKITNIFLLDIYTIDKKLSSDDLSKLASALCNPVTQIYQLINEKNNYTLDAKRYTLDKFDWAIEIGYLPGVTDNVSHTVQEIATDLLKITFDGEERVYTSQVTFIKGSLTENEVTELANSMYNPLIQRAHIKSRKQFEEDGGMDVVAPNVKLTKVPSADEVDLNITDEELAKIGKAGIANPDGTRRGPLALDLAFMKAIQKYFKKLGRKPRDIEIESLAQTWSEHCKHTIFANPMDEIKDGIYKSYIQGATKKIREDKGKDDFCVSVFTDNSGGIAFDDEYLVTHKAESHNSPSALDPFGGAITGIVGVNRDTIGFGLGAKPVANYYGFCFADPRVDVPLYKGPNFTQKMLSAKRIMDGVIQGVNEGGNQSGIPTPQGFVYFDERFRGKPLVIVGTIGLIPRKIKGKLSHLKKAMPSDYIVVIGNRVGKDGIHGATFSSEAMDTGSPATAVQIGDPITQKKLSDALVKEARDLLLYNSITDNGAGGLSCSVAEMAKESNGCLVDLEKVPLKYPGLEPWEIWISESQERMTLAVPPKNLKKFVGLMESRGVETSVIGKFTDSGKCVVHYNKKTIMDIDLQFLHYGLPQRPTTTTYNPPLFVEPPLPKTTTFTSSLETMLTRLNITSYAFISNQYDYVVQGNSVLPPLQGKGRVNGETSVFRPVLSSQKGVILSQGFYPNYTEIDAYKMSAASIDTAIRNAVSNGANPDYLAILDNFFWCSSTEPERLGQLKQSAKACYDYAVAYGTPYIAGKDSMFNDFNGFNEKGEPVKISIPPTLLISSIGVVEDITTVVSLDVKNSGDLIYVLGETFDELGGSEYYAMLSEEKKKNFQSNQVPSVNAKKNYNLYLAVYNAVQKRLLASSISVTKGGLAVALAKTAIGGQLGLEVDLNNLPGKTSSDHHALYAESQGRIVVTIKPTNKAAFEKIMEGNAFQLIGKVTKSPELIIKSGKHELVNFDLTKATNTYRDTFKDY